MAANTDKFKKKRSNFSTTLNGSIASGDTTINLSSAANLPTDTAVLLTIDRVDANGNSTPTKMERVVGVVSANQLTNCLRGVDNSPSAQSHASGAVVEDIWDALSWNDSIDGFLANHNQDGTNSKVTGMTNNTAVTQKDAGGTARQIAKLNSNNVLELGVSGASALEDVYLTDSGSANALAVTCSPVPVAYAAGMALRIKVANANTTAVTLNVNSLGTKTIKKLDGATDLASGDLAAGQIISVQYDGTNFQLRSPVANAPGTVTLAGTQTLTNKRITRRVVTVTQSATPTINTDNTDVASITALAQAITSMTTNLSGTPNTGDFLEIQITDNGTARALTFGASFVATTIALPTTTVISTLLRVLFEWNGSAWACVATA